MMGRFTGEHLAWILVAGGFCATLIGAGIYIATPRPTIIETYHCDHVPSVDRARFFDACSHKVDKCTTAFEESFCRRTLTVVSIDGRELVTRDTTSVAP
jgi:hypothetical protein